MAKPKKKTVKKTTRKSSRTTKSNGVTGGSGKAGSPDRCDWIVNQGLIEDCYCNLIKESGRVPTATRIAELTGLHRETVGKHLKQFDFGRVRRRLGIALNIALGRAIENATQKGAFFKDIELLFKIGGELVDKIEHGGQVDFRSYREKLSNDDGEQGDDFERAKKLSQILVYENFIE